MKKCYWISLYLELKNHENLKKYAEKVTPIIKKQFLLKSDFLTKMINLFVVEQSS